MGTVQLSTLPLPCQMTFYQYMGRG